VLLVIGDGAEVMDTLFPFYRLGEDFQVVVAGPEKRTYHLVIHELVDGWDITRERSGYHLDSDVAFRDVETDDYVALVLPGGRAPEYLRYDSGSRGDHNSQVSLRCHGLWCCPHRRSGSSLRKPDMCAR
jgi:protease I